jgi:WD40 repeat protein
LSVDPAEQAAEPPTLGGVYRVDAQGAEAVLAGDHGTQINYFYGGATISSGASQAPLVAQSGFIASPYRGLNAFDERDAALFYGRETVAAEVLEAISRRLRDPGVLVVSGASGAGKSSLIRAGVLPRIRGGELSSASASWPCLIFTPTRAPLAELATRIAPLAGTDASLVRQSLESDPAGFALTARQVALAGPAPGGACGGGVPDQRVLVVVDQLEQLFTQCEKVEERQAFFTALDAAATSRHGDGQLPSAVVVLVVRADFEARLADYPSLTAAVQDRYLLTSMTSRQLRMAISQPAAQAGSSVDSDLVNVLLDEVRGRAAGPHAHGHAAAGAGVLPLLSHALDQAWRQRAGAGLTLADYERSGGIDGAVASSAQRCYDGLTPAQQETARQVFTRLTATSSDGVNTADRVSRADLFAGKISAQVEDTETVLQTFAAERLLTLGASTAEISHEALLTAWPLLRDTWLADTRVDRITSTRLRAAAEEWIRASRDTSYLYRGAVLEAASAAASRMGSGPHDHQLSGAESGFLHAGERAERRRVRARQCLTAILAVLVVGLAAVAITAQRASQDASRQLSSAISERLASESQNLGDDNATASQLEAIAAWSIAPSPQARYAMLAAAARPGIAAITASSAAVTSVAFSPDGKTLATGSEAGQAQLWNVTTGQPIGAPLNAGADLDSVAFSPDGKVLATGSADVRLWNVATGQQIGAPLDVGNDADSVAFSPDGATLATGDYDAQTRLWDVATGRQIATLARANTGVIWSVAFSPDGRILAVGDAESAQLWDVATHRRIGNPLRIDSTILSVAFSPDGKLLATGSYGPTQLWDVATQRRASSLSADGGSINSLAFSPDGKTLVGGGPLGVRMWDLATGQQDGPPLSGSTSGTDSMALSPDGTILATGDDQGLLHVWKATTGPPPTIGSVLSFASAGFDPKFGALGAEQVNAEPIQVFRVNSSEQISEPLPIKSNLTNSVAFSPDGKVLATGSNYGRARLWNLATGTQIGATLSVGFGIVTAMALSPDGKILATAIDGKVRLWNLANGQQIRATLTVNDDIVTAMAFSPDGKTLAISPGNGVRLWNLETHVPVGETLAVSPGGVESVTFSPDGKTLATGGQFGARLWDMDTRQQIGGLLAEGDGPAVSVAFNSDGTVLIVDGAFGIQAWNTGYLVHPLAQLCAHLGGIITQSEWRQYVPSGQDYREACR